MKLNLCHLSFHFMTKPGQVNIKLLFLNSKWYYLYTVMHTKDFRRVNAPAFWIWKITYDSIFFLFVFDRYLCFQNQLPPSRIHINKCSVFKVSLVFQLPCATHHCGHTSVKCQTNVCTRRVVCVWRRRCACVRTSVSHASAEAWT